MIRRSLPDGFNFDYTAVAKAISTACECPVTVDGKGNIEIDGAPTPAQLLAAKTAVIALRRNKDPDITV